MGGGGHRARYNKVFYYGAFDDMERCSALRAATDVHGECVTITVEGPSEGVGVGAYACCDSAYIIGHGDGFAGIVEAAIDRIAELIPLCRIGDDERRPLRIEGSVGCYGESVACFILCPRAICGSVPAVEDIICGGCESIGLHCHCAAIIVWAVGVGHRTRCAAVVFIVGHRVASEGGERRGDDVALATAVDGFHLEGVIGARRKACEVDRGAVGIVPSTVIVVLPIAGAIGRPRCRSGGTGDAANLQVCRVSRLHCYCHATRLGASTSGSFYPICVGGSCGDYSIGISGSCARGA